LSQGTHERGGIGGGVQGDEVKLRGTDAVVAEEEEEEEEEEEQATTAGISDVTTTGALCALAFAPGPAALTPFTVYLAAGEE
jgi:hypothetical protein